MAQEESAPKKQATENRVEPPNTQAELQSIMEECKRLQSANAKLKQMNDEYKVS